MALPLANTALKARLTVRQSLSVKRSRCRPQSTTSTHRLVDRSVAKESSDVESVSPTVFSAPPLARLSTSSILRTLLLSTFFTSPILFRSGYAVFHKVANSQSAWLNPDRNPILRAVIFPLIYKQFCAGRNRAEIEQTSSEIRRLGFSGIVLCYGKEVQLSADNCLIGLDESRMNTMEAEIDQWKHGNLKTLKMVGEGDWLGIKYTGAGNHITRALMQGEKAPPSFIEAMDSICERAAAQGCRIWIDAEQQILQATIDQWSFEFMRRFNRHGKQALLYNTIQAYLKSSRDKVSHQMQLAQREGWRLGIKLVRGAYISNDIRERIHDTKADTDAAYDGIVQDLLHGRFRAVDNKQKLNIDLLLAGHNTDTIRRAARIASELAAQSKLKVIPEFGQLQGMADDIGCELLQIADDASRQIDSPRANIFVPKVYKCLTWGSIQECMQYLTRRLVENRGAADRMREGAAEFRRELFRRFIRRFWRRRPTIIKAG